MTGSPGQDRREPRSRLIGSFTRSTGEWAVLGVWLGQAWLAKSIWSYILTINQTDWLPGMAHKTPWYEEVTTPPAPPRANHLRHGDAPSPGHGRLRRHPEEWPVSHRRHGISIGGHAAGKSGQGP